MSNQAKFYDMPTEPPPLNRRVYAAAKAPFAYIWVFVRWVCGPWFQALPFAFVAAAVASALAHSGSGPDATLAKIVQDTFAVGLVWTAYLGALVFFVKAVRALFK